MGRRCDDVRKLLELVADDVSLTAMFFQVREDVRSLRMLDRPVEARRGGPNRVLVPLAAMGPWMEDHIVDAEGLRSLEFFDKRHAACN